MKKIIWTAFVACVCGTTHAQELYVSTEPASNMAAGSIGFRLASRLYKMNYNHSFSSCRIQPEVMIGAGKKWMIHLAGYGSDMYQKKFKTEGGSLYAKYRLYSTDDVHKHFRIAVFSEISVINNPQQLTVVTKKAVPDGNGGYTEVLMSDAYTNDEFDIEGNNSGIMGGVVATKLVNRLALSASLNYGYRLNNVDDEVAPEQPLHAVSYSASLGYLLFPKEYISYDQTNVNLYMEMLGTAFPGYGKSYTDIVPAIQFIFKSIGRLDLAYRLQATGNAQRLSNNYFMLRLEYNLLNAF